MQKMTTFKAAIAICGLSQKEAEIFLNVNENTIGAWCRAKNQPPIGVWRQLADLYARIENAADFTSSNLEPELMDKRDMNQTTADDGENNLPGHADYAAGAMAILLAIRDEEHE